MIDVIDNGPTNKCNDLFLMPQLIWLAMRWPCLFKSAQIRSPFSTTVRICGTHPVPLKASYLFAQFKKKQARAISDCTCRST